MCGIVGVVGKADAVNVIFDALRRLEYRGYDSAGIATLAPDGIACRRASGKLDNLEKILKESPILGNTGVGHTRWATHGAPTESNAHPHSTERVAIVHNGIIENFEELRNELEAKGQTFVSETDSEAIVQLVDYYLQQGCPPQEAAFLCLQKLRGAYALAMVFKGHDGLMIGARHGAPLVVGYGDDAMFLGSDSLALAPLTQKITYLHDGDHVIIEHDSAKFFDESNNPVAREVKVTALVASSIGKDGYRHYMEKELHEHPAVIGQTLLRMIDPAARHVSLPELPLPAAQIERVTMTACGSAFYAGLIGRYWMEEIARLPVDIDVASELRYRTPPMPSGGLGVLISQSGETADTLAALRMLRQAGQSILSVLNVEQSTMARESDIVLGTVAGPEICVASTKAFTAQLSVLACLVIYMARLRGTIGKDEEQRLVAALLDLPSLASDALQIQEPLQRMAQIIAEARDVLYIGRGIYYPVAMEGALKLKEITYIHAEAYAAGEMKHGPIALVDRNVPVVGLAPSGPLFDKMVSNLQEAKARGGRILAFTDKAGAKRLENIAEVTAILPDIDAFAAPVLYTIPVQYLAYEVALLKGTDVDQPRNLAKSVTVE